jgi:hypothetical protein
MISKVSLCLFEKFEVFEKRPPVVAPQGFKTSEVVNPYQKARDPKSKGLNSEEEGSPGALYMRFRQTSINRIAGCICGDDPLPFPYRTGRDLSEFFTGLGLDFRHQGQSRNDFVRATLTTINLAAPKDGNLPSPEMISIITC